MHWQLCRCIGGEEYFAEVVVLSFPAIQGDTERFRATRSDAGGHGAMRRTRIRDLRYHYNYKDIADHEFLDPNQNSFNINEF